MSSSDAPDPGAAGTVRTVHLGQFTDENAEVIAARLHAAGITWWHKSSGRIAQFVFADSWGVRLFVDESRLDDARAIVTDVLGR